MSVLLQLAADFRATDEYTCRVVWFGHSQELLDCVYCIYKTRSQWTANGSKAFSACGFDCAFGFISAKVRRLL